MKGHLVKALVVLLTLYAIAIFVMATPAMAQEEPPAGATSTPSERSPEANLPYLFAVYTVTWIAFFAYLFYLSQKQRELRREVEELRKALADRRAQGPDPRGGG